MGFMRQAGVTGPLALLLWLAPVPPAPAADAPPPPDPDSIVWTGFKDAEAELGGTLTLTTQGPGPGAEKAHSDPALLRLRLNHHTFAALEPARSPGGQIEFDLSGIDKDPRGRVLVIGAPPPGGVVRVEAGLVWADGTPVGYAGAGAPEFSLTVFPIWRVGIAAAVVLAIVATVAMLGWKTDLLRDSQSAELAADANHVRPYSLAKFQMAVWFVLITASFVMLVMITRDVNNIVTAQALEMLGLSGVTAVGAGAITAAKNIAPTDTTRHLPHVTFFRDLLTDETGAWSFARLQAFFWTLLLGGVTLSWAHSNLQLPDFDANLTLLQAVSSGLYLGFKGQEKQG